MTTLPLLPVDLSTEVFEHALAHAEQPTAYCDLCASGSKIRPEDFELAIDARLYNAQLMLVSMVRHLGSQRYPQISLTALHQLLSEVVLLREARVVEPVLVAKEI